MSNLDSLGRLLNSRNPKAQILGLTVVLLVFMPNVFRIAGDPNLTFWQRLEQVTQSAGQTILTVLAVAIPPGAIADKQGASTEEAGQSESV